jgi:hypothetical protein
LIRVPTPAPVIGATLAMMRNTSAKASVTSAKYEPLRPERNVRKPITTPTTAPAAMPSAKANQALTP